MNLTKFNEFLSTLNFVLFFIGTQLVTSMFLPISSDLERISRTVTIPYRAFALFISLFVIILNINYYSKKTPFALKVLWFFWIAIIIRIFYDINIRTDVSLKNSSQLWLYIFGICLPAMYSVMKSIRIINLTRALKWVYLGLVLTLILSLFNNSSLLLDSSAITERANANLALNSITFGHVGTTSIILTLFFLSKGGTSLMKKTVLIAIVLLSFFIMIRAGSRSPVVALVVILLFWIFSRGKKIIISVSSVIIATSLLVVFIKPILSFLGQISPVMESRLKLAIYEQYSSGRELLYEKAFNIFLDNPIIGEQFALFTENGGYNTLKKLDHVLN